MDGIFLVDKPTGVTSHDVVRHIKHKFQLKKVGHTGTLDPFASGLLIVCVGKATKMSNLLSSNDKSYTGTIVFGNHYDTYDTTGNIMKENAVLVNKDDVLEAMQSFIGGYDQEPPMHSAIKIDGQKLYKLAHQGKSIERPKRRVNIEKFELLSFRNNELDFEVHVSKGTYIRSLAVDLAQKLHTYGALSVLRRTTIGEYHIDHAHSLEDITLEDMITLEDFFSHYPKLVLNDYMINLVKNGVMLDERQTTVKHAFIVVDSLNNYIAYYEPTNDNTYKPLIIF